MHGEDFRGKLPGGGRQDGVDKVLWTGKKTGEARELRGLPVVEDRNTRCSIHCLKVMF